MKIKTGKTKLRLTGNSTFNIDVDVPEDNMLVVSSDFTKKSKLIVYTDLLMSGKNTITIYNSSQYFIDIMEDDVVAELKPIIPNEKRDTKEKLSDKK